MSAPYDVKRVLAVLALTMGAGFSSLITALGASTLIAVIPAVVPVLFLALLAMAEDTPASAPRRAES